MKIRLLTALILVLALLLCGCKASTDTLSAAGNTPLAGNPGESAPEQVPSPAEELIGETEAQAIALEHAGFTADQVTGLRTEYDVDDGVKEYEVEFRSDDWDYDYTVHGETGELLSCDKEYDPPKAAPAPTEPAATKPTAEPPKLTAEEAQAIALEHAGFTADQVTGLRTEYDVDDGVKEYEVEFRRDGWEYEYDIHAETGELLLWDKELDD